MGANVDQRMVCPECGHHLLETSSGVVVYARRVRRRVLLVWLVLVSLVGVMALPWVQVWLGEWGWRYGVRVGNYSAVWEYEPIAPRELGYRALIEPPVRWKDLRLAGEGDLEAIDLFRRSLQGFGRMYVRDGSVGERALVFGVGSPVFDPMARSGTIVVDGEEVESSFSSYGYSTVGWPVAWASYSTQRLYARGDQWDTEDRFLSVEEDLVSSSVTTRRIRWLNIVFLVIVGSGLCVAGRRVCRWRGMSSGRGWSVGLAVSGVYACVVLSVGLGGRSVYGNDGINGAFEPVRMTDQREWGVDGFFERLESDDQTRLIAQGLIEGFGEMTGPNEFVLVGVVNDIEEGYMHIQYGLGGLRLFSFSRTWFVGFEADGSSRSVMVPEDNVVSGLWFGDGYAGANRSFGASARSVYGVGVGYLNIIIAGVAMYVVWRLMLWVGWRMSSLVQRRRVRRGLCVWCRYPCVDEG